VEVRGPVTCDRLRDEATRVSHSSMVGGCWEYSKGRILWFQFVLASFELASITTPARQPCGWAGHSRERLN